MKLISEDGRYLPNFLFRRDLSISNVTTCFGRKFGNLSLEFQRVYSIIYCKLFLFDFCGHQSLQYAPSHDLTEFLIKEHATIA